ncbi:MAG: YqaE/Pmp3 family membrane protein [Planctomycetota bacterium]|nr:YqaE/Pmp3 family membrane protein [Planctomycetota bacterium]
MQTNKLLLVIIAILLPPVAVGIKKGIGLSLVINIVLCLLFYIPGLIHALLVVLKD